MSKKYIQRDHESSQYYSQQARRLLLDILPLSHSHLTITIQVNAPPGVQLATTLKDDIHLKKKKR